MANLSRKSGKFLLLFGAATLFLASCTESVAPVYDGPAVSIVETKSISDLEKAFYHHRYDIKHLRQGVPPIIFATLPEELAKVSSSSRKKELFFQTLLPMVLLANKEIRQERKKFLQLEDLVNRGQELDSAQYHVLRTLQHRYAVKGKATAPATLAKLKNRIDQVPAELALAQAANESAWGTSRFSQEGNNLFGEWTFKPGTGIIPEGRPEGATYEVRRFSTLFDSIRSYLRNLNTHPAYANFRQLRAAARGRGETPSGMALAEGLSHYSTRRDAYVDDLQNLIRQNNLQRFAQASLRQS